MRTFKTRDCTTCEFVHFNIFAHRRHCISCTHTRESRANAVARCQKPSWTRLGRGGTASGAVLRTGWVLGFVARSEDHHGQIGGEQSGEFGEDVCGPDGVAGGRELVIRFASQQGWGFYRCPPASIVASAGLTVR